MQDHRTRRIRLTALKSEAGLPSTGLVDAVGYSRFKHGDAAVGRRYAMALAALAARALDGQPVQVTTSAFDRVPPAAHSLLAPFVQHLRTLRPDLDVTAFRVLRRGVSNGDYSQMTIADRRCAVGPGNLTPERDVRGARVLALDDIRVTGTHELAMDACLLAAGVEQVRHLYIVDAHDFAGSPRIESVLNEAAIDGVDTLLQIAATPRFVPNARFCRRVLALPADQLVVFLRGASPALRGWLCQAIEFDGLAGVPAYAERVRAWEAVVTGAGRRVGAGAS
ncbi:phosphoribosyltransferase family protein [Flexivirga meconopsidis]|uniref:phosphoribosyltransferase family protein n=1 Tax=Flexivirga meconopsidis TaxID=2977121 RepID=UPI00223ED04A|nr:phosphoribosyltransferase family protein [Flexivirga meconopsidis]